MKRAQLEREYLLNIHLERNLERKQVLPATISKSQYQIMTTWVLEVTPLQTRVLWLLFLIPLIQHLDDLECHKSTKYLAKTYLDIYLSQTKVPDESLHLLAISVARLSVKFNESEDYPISLAQKMGNFRYLSEEFIKMENDVLVALGFNLNYITPYDYIPIFSQLIPFPSHVYEELDDLLDFCCTCIEWTTLSAGQMILSCLLYLAYCNDPEKIAAIKQYGCRFTGIQQVVCALDRKAMEGLQSAHSLQSLRSLHSINIL